MDFDEYVAARYGALLRAAVLMGCAEAHAAELVEQVLARSAKRIRRSEDPDPFVHEALAHAIPGSRATRFGADPLARQELLMSAEPVTTDAVSVGHLEVPPREVNLPAAAAMFALALVLVAAALVGPGHRDPPLRMAIAQVPSLFAYDGDDARRLLADSGVNVVEKKVHACEPSGRVLGSQPVTGELIRSGDTLTIHTSAPSIPACLRGYADRLLAWQFIDFATGHGPSPAFAAFVQVAVDRAEPAVLTDDQAGALAGWGWRSAVTELADATRQVRWVDTAYELPELAVTSGTPPAYTCDVPRPPLFGERSAVSLTISLPGDDPLTCPVRVDLYRDDGQIDAVVLYTRKPAPRT